ncbi:hypothetical protein OUZ56_019907 [Daphnia magna]|uniref:Uncharacterized protein n=1 Tax=Daphnia magna TaxID=35525 RepID=A0ABQ9ZCZ5_9CRUS|nr:hypothetical protein OUZ56_019907 [Daphnia magna]
MGRSGKVWINSSALNNALEEEEEKKPSKLSGLFARTAHIFLCRRLKRFFKVELTIVRPLEYRLTPGSGSDDLMMDITPQTAIHFLFLFLKGAPDSQWPTHDVPSPEMFVLARKEEERATNELELK